MLFYLWPACLIDYARAPVITDSFFSIADSNPRLVTAYLSSIFSLPITASSGERLTHEEVVARLDDETVSYESELGIRGYFEEMFRVSIKVEKEKYETAVRWMKDLIYGADFDVTRYEKPTNKHTL